MSYTSNLKKKKKHALTPKVQFSLFSVKTIWFKPSSLFLNFLKKNNKNKNIMVLSNQILQKENMM